MARQSAEAKLTVVAGQFGTRPEPPDDLTDRQKAVWRDISGSEAANFFSTAASRAMLADLCRHRETMEVVTNAVNEFRVGWLSEDGGPERLDRLTKIRDRECKAATSLATKLRLTNQSRYTPKAAATASKHASEGPRPWEDAIRKQG
jgi:hypothetical protein